LKELLQDQGNPLFLEETIRMLIDSHLLVGQRGSYRLMRALQKLRIPPTVQAILTARIDRLPAPARKLLHAASVIGNDVPHAILHGIGGLPEDDLRRVLAELREAEFLYETRQFPDVHYTFKHALTHDVSYGSLLAEDRKMLHRQIVRFIEELYPDRLTEFAEQLAHHALCGELHEKAVHYLRQSGLKSAARSALQDARTWFEQALHVLSRTAESPSTLEQAFDIRLEIRQVLVQLSEFRASLKLMREAEGLAERLNDDRRLARVCTFMTGDQTMLGQLDEALATGIRAANIASGLGELRLRILANTYLARLHFIRGEYKRVAVLATDNIAGLPSEWIHDYFGMGSPPSVYDRYWLILSQAHVGKFAEVTEHTTHVIELAESTQRPHPIILAYSATATLHLLKGDWGYALPLIETAISTQQLNLAITPINLSAWVLAQLGEASKAKHRLRKGEQFVEDLLAKGASVYSAWEYHALGRAYLLRGLLDDARRNADRAVESSSSQPGFAAYALHLIGDIATHPDQSDPKSGETYYRQALRWPSRAACDPLSLTVTRASESCIGA